MPDDLLLRVDGVRASERLRGGEPSAWWSRDFGDSGAPVSPTRVGLVLGPSYNWLGCCRGAIVDEGGDFLDDHEGEEAHGAHGHCRTRRDAAPSDERPVLTDGGPRGGRNRSRLLERVGPGAEHPSRRGPRRPVPAAPGGHGAHSQPSSTWCPTPGSWPWLPTSGRRPCRPPTQRVRWVRLEGRFRSTRLARHRLDRPGRGRRRPTARAAGGVRLGPPRQAVHDPGCDRGGSRRRCHRPRRGVASKRRGIRASPARSSPRRGLVARDGGAS